MTGLINSAFRRVSAAVHGLAGRVCFRLGHLARSRRHFERVLQLRDDDFIAYVHLGRLAYCVGDYAGWRREFEHARRSDPVRFQRLRALDMFEPRAAGTLFDEAGARATWRTVRLPMSPGRRPAGRHTELPAEPQIDFEIGPACGLGGESPTGDRELLGEGHDCLETGLRRFGDDFSSQQERERFRDEEPISTADLDATDIDDLCRRLQ